MASLSDNFTVIKFSLYLSVCQLHYLSFLLLIFYCTTRSVAPTLYYIPASKYLLLSCTLFSLGGLLKGSSCHDYKHMDCDFT